MILQPYDQEHPPNWLRGPVADDLLLDLAYEAKAKASSLEPSTGSSFSFSNKGTWKSSSGTNSVLPCHNSGANHLERELRGRILGARIGMPLSEVQVR